MCSLRDIYTKLSKKKNLKNLTYFLILNISFMFVEVIYGLISNSLGLLTDGAHMLLDSTAVIIGLYSTYLSDFDGDTNYNFGYKRSEILGTFINSVFLFFIALYIIFESIERFITPRLIQGDNLILVSFLGLIVNLVGIYFFHEHNDDDDDEDEDEEDININNSNEINLNENEVNISLDKDSSEIKDNTETKYNNIISPRESYEKIKNEDNDDSNKLSLDTEQKNIDLEQGKINITNQHGHSHHHNHNHHVHNHGEVNENLYAIYIHILADTLGSVAVLISSFLIRFHSLYISDPICSLLISLMIFYSTIPVLKNSIITLLHFQSDKINEKKKEIINSLKDLKINSDNENKITINILKFDIWELKKSKLFCEMQISISPKISKLTKDDIGKQIKEIMKSNKIVHQYIEII